jgi:hypothetical protein
MFASKIQPYCRTCGRAIKRYTITNFFGYANLQNSSSSRYHAEEIKTRDEAARQLNERVVSFRKGYRGKAIVGTWDGESYVDPYFCTERCAATFGRMAAREHPTLQTVAAVEAHRARS